MTRLGDLLAISTILLVVTVTKSYCDDNKTLSSSQADSGLAKRDDEEPYGDGPTLKREMAETRDILNDKNKTKEDNHTFYKPEYITNASRAMSYWVDFSKLAGSDHNNSFKHDMLSKSHRRAAPIKLSFDFPFYGHPLRNVIIATGGFLYVGEHLHHWLAATQNISPLMANFDLSLSNSSDLFYYDNGTSLTVQWLDVQMKDNNPPGNFSFQATLHKNGDIILVYKHLAVPISQIPEEEHPVKVGISDAFLFDNVAYFIRRKTIFDYHRLNMKESSSIGNQTAIYLKALPTCNQYDTCETCAKADDKMECVWCPSVKRCSNGLDRKRQEWLKFECNLIKKSDCSTKTESPISVGSSSADQLFKAMSSNEHGVNVSGRQSLPDTATPERESSGAVIFPLLIFFSLTAGLGLWVMHAYNNPHTPSGQMLIKYRPSNWRWQAPETRYTAASIHM